jgi:hypothetical protein
VRDQSLFQSTLPFFELSRDYTTYIELDEESEDTISVYEWTCTRCEGVFFTPGMLGKTAPCPHCMKVSRVPGHESETLF